MPYVKYKHLLGKFSTLIWSEEGGAIRNVLLRITQMYALWRIDKKL